MGLATLFSSPPRAATNERTKVVFPAPRGPSRAMTSPSWRCAARAAARRAVAAGSASRRSMASPIVGSVGMW